MAEPGSLAVAGFVDRNGSVEAARLIRSGDVPTEVESATASRRASSDGDADIEAAARGGVRLLVPESNTWPHFAFAGLYRAQQRRLRTWSAGERTPRYGAEPTVPLALWVRGPLPVVELGIRAVAVVGARAATTYGERCASDLSYGLARAGVTVVSGGALGIDASAHRGALAAGAATVLVSPGGLDRPYPSAHRNLYEQIAATGLLVGESPPGAAPQKHRFLSRNRLIAALSSATVVVEAAMRSGALNTAAHCVAIGRPLLAVPGPITSAMSAGCHELLRRDGDPARLVTSVDDVLEFVGHIGETAATAPAAQGRAASGTPDDGALSAVPARSLRPGDDLDPSARCLLDAFPARGWVSEDQLCLRSGLAIMAVLRSIPVLRMSALVESGEDGHRLLARAVH